MLRSRTPAQRAERRARRADRADVLVAGVARRTHRYHPGRARRGEEQRSVINEQGEFWFGDAPIVAGIEIVALGSGAERAVGVYAPGRANLEIEAEDVRRLRDALTAWLDAPRDAARAAAEVVATGDGFRLLRTSLGEWGVDDESGADTGEWFAAADAETLARVMYAVARGKIRCPACGAESEAAEAMGPDGIEACAACGVMS